MSDTHDTDSMHRPGTQSVTGPVMLCATQILKHPSVTIGHIAGNFSLPRPVRVVTLLASGSGALLGAVVGIAVGGLRGAIYGAIFLGALGAFMVTYSPLKGESFLTWIGLTIRTRRRHTSIDGKPVQVSVGIMPVPQPRSGPVRLHAGSVRIFSDQWDERGVLRSAGNQNLGADVYLHAPRDPHSGQSVIDSVRGVRQEQGPGWSPNRQRVAWSSGPTEGMMPVYASRSQLRAAQVLQEREDSVRAALLGPDAPRLISPEDRIATKNALAEAMSLRPEQVILGDAGLPGMMVPLRRFRDGRPHLIEAGSFSATLARAADPLIYADDTTAAWVARRVGEREEQWARRLFHAKVELGAIDPTTGQEVDWLRVSGIDTSGEEGRRQVELCLEGKPSSLDSVTAHLSVESLALIDSGTALLDLWDATGRRQLQAQAAIDRDVLLLDTERDLEAASEAFVQVARDLRETAAELTSELNKAVHRHWEVVQELRASLSRQASELVAFRAGVTTLASALRDMYCILLAVDRDDDDVFGTADRLYEEFVKRGRESVEDYDRQQQLVLAPFYRDDLNKHELAQVVDDLKRFVQSQLREAATTVEESRSVRVTALAEIAKAMQSENSDHARTESTSSRPSASILFAAHAIEPFPG